MLEGRILLAARRALSHRGGRVLALGRFLWRERSKVSGQPFKDAVRGSCMLMACGAAACAPSTQLLPGENSEALYPGRPQASSLSPAASRGCSSKTLLSPRHWDLVSSLEPLVNPRSGSQPP